MEALLRVAPPPLGPLGGVLAVRRRRGQVSGGQQQSNYVESFDKQDVYKDAVRKEKVKAAFRLENFRAAKSHNPIHNLNMLLQTPF